MSVEMVVVADLISNRTVVAVAPREGQALVAGDNAAFTVDPRDQYGNQLNSQDQQVLNQVHLVVDMFRMDPVLGIWTEVVGLQVRQMLPSTTAYFMRLVILYLSSEA